MSQTEVEEPVEGKDWTRARALAKRMLRRSEKWRLHRVAKELVDGTVRNFGYPISKSLWLSNRLKRILRDVGPADFSDGLLLALTTCELRQCQQIGLSFYLAQQSPPQVQDMFVQVACWSDSE